ncbi:MAG: hypothetical protein WCP30_17190, partial [Mycobacteriaceae bacterium]
VWAGLQAEGILPRNVVALVEALRKPSNGPVMKTDDSLIEDEIEKLLSAEGSCPDSVGVQWISMRRPRPSRCRPRG